MNELVQTIISFVLLGVMGILILILDQVVTPFHRGFFKDDQTLAYPYHGSTIPSHYLHIVGVIIPFSLILIHHFIHSDRKCVMDKTELKNNFVVNALPTLTGYIFGAAATQILTDVGKTSVGRLRPHFFDVCKPKYTNGTNGDFPNYITNYSCIGNSDLFPDVEEREDRIREVSLSFPSGHSSFAFQAATFTILYLQAKFSKGWAKNSLLVPFFQLLVLAVAFYTGISRIMDYKHHPTDVIAGSLIGIVTQILNVFGVTLIFLENQHPVSASVKNSKESIPLSQRNNDEDTQADLTDKH